MAKHDATLLGQFELHSSQIPVYSDSFKKQVGVIEELYKTDGDKMHDIIVFMNHYEQKIKILNRWKTGLNADRLSKTTSEFGNKGLSLRKSGVTKSKSEKDTSNHSLVTKMMSTRPFLGDLACKQKLPGYPAKDASIFNDSIFPTKINSKTSVTMRSRHNCHLFRPSLYKGYEDRANAVKVGSLKYDDSLKEWLVYEGIVPTKLSKIMGDPKGKKAKISGLFSDASEGKLQGEDLFIEPGRAPKIFEEIMASSKNRAIWQSLRGRITETSLKYVEDGEKVKINIPFTTAHGTATRRTTDRLTMVLPNSQSKMGSELKSLIQAPEGYKFVGADVDSEELWIASLFGDAIQGLGHGSTVLGKMILTGNKDEGTDLHTMVAKKAGIGRNVAKAMNYARMYGGGENLAKNTLLQYNKTISGPDASKIIKDMYGSTKGVPAIKCGEKLTREFEKMGDSGSQVFLKGERLVTTSEFKDLVSRKPHVKYWDHETGYFLNGTDSEAFNFMSLLAKTIGVNLPTLGSQMPTSIAYAAEVSENFVQGIYLGNTKTNWTIQSSGVDYLHLILLSMKWFNEIWKLDVRLVVAIHDEVRFMCPDKSRYRTALALHLTNMYVRSIFTLRIAVLVRILAQKTVNNGI